MSRAPESHYPEGKVHPEVKVRHPEVTVRHPEVKVRHPEVTVRESHYPEPQRLPAFRE
jgi:hypothetical protein